MLRVRFHRGPGRAFDPFFAVKHEVRVLPVTATRRPVGWPRPTASRSLSLTERGARDFARRSPAVAIGAAVAVGFALSRFLKATASSPADRYRRNAYSLEDDDEMPSLTTTRTAGSTQPRYNA